MKTLEKLGECFQYMNNVFTHLSDNKIKGVFVVPNRKRLMKEINILR